MSDTTATPEEIARYFIEPFKSYMPETELKDEELEEHIRELKENIEAHTAQRLDKLKEKAKDLGYRSIWEGDKEILLVEREDVLQLIEEQTNE